MSPSVWALFLVAAGLGACARYLLDGFVQARTDGEFPWGTCLINVSGSFVLGIITGLALYHGLGIDSKLVLGTGFCGAYTTFSTFSYETVRLVEGGVRGAAVRNVAVNTVGGLLAAGLGLALMAAG
ncbi:MAG TPA: fluoride efflux transporter CrcB [Acidimicrobiales bacterium]|nr:fluoride efflux transporter CrcB [Acidimicrobiales bacterium]